MIISKLTEIFPKGEFLKMKKLRILLILTLFCFYLLPGLSVFAQENKTPVAKSQEYSEEDGVPVLTKHLPDYENVGNRAAYILNADDLRAALGMRPVFEAIDFTGGVEAVTAEYPQGKLLIVEYTTPQFSVDADNKIKQKLAETAPTQNPPVIYRRIGNYGAFVFDGADAAAANALLDQVKYEKDVRWLGEDPFALQRAERHFVLQASDLFLNVVLAIVGALGASVLIGIVVGFLFFYVREHKRAQMETFTDAGGMTRLNLDGFTPDILPDRLLDK
jgi:hypothetical protein